MGKIQHGGGQKSDAKAFFCHCHCRAGVLAGEIDIAEQTRLLESGEHVFPVAVRQNQRLLGKFRKRKGFTPGKKRVRGSAMAVMLSFKRVFVSQPFKTIGVRSVVRSTM